MSYPQPRASFPDSAFPAPGPSFPQQQQQQQWQPQQPQASPNDFQFYTPPPAQQQQQQAPMPGYGQQTSPPQAYAEPWRADAGVQMRQGPGGGGMGGHHAPHMSQSGGQVAFMPAQLGQLAANPMAGMAFDYGKASLAKNLSWVMSFLSALKYYFHVNNRYVVAKLRVLMLPFMHSNWKRERMDGGGMQGGGGGMGGGSGGASPLMGGGGGGGVDDSSVLGGLVGAPVYKAARDDINAPDLYIPTMAFVTMILLMGYALGTAGQFHPEVLGLTASRALVLLLFEVLALKFGLYLIAVGPVAAPASLLDLVAYASYKYTHCIVMIAIGLALGSWAFYGAILALGATAALFMMRTMKRVCTPAASGPGLGDGGVSAAHAYGGGMSSSFGQGKHRRNYFLLIVGAAQIFFSWLLVRTANQGF